MQRFWTTEKNSLHNCEKTIVVQKLIFIISFHTVLTLHWIIKILRWYIAILTKLLLLHDTWSDLFTLAYSICITTNTSESPYLKMLYMTLNCQNNIITINQFIVSCLLEGWITHQYMITMNTIIINIIRLSSSSQYWINPYQKPCVLFDLCSTNSWCWITPTEST